MRGIGNAARHTGRHAAIKHPCRCTDLMDMEDEKEAPYIFTYALVINNARRTARQQHQHLSEEITIDADAHPLIVEVLLVCT